MRHVKLTGELQEEAALFAAGAMDREEAAEYLRHLEDERCEPCSREAAELRSVMALLAYDLPARTPSPALKLRLMDQARAMSAATAAQRVVVRKARPRWLEWVLGVTTAAAVAALVLVYSDNNQLRQLNDALASRITALESQISRQRVMLATFTSPDVRVVNLAGQNQNPQASGRIFWDRRQNRWLFYAKDLPRLAANLTYQLWFVPTAGNPISATVFNTDAGGVASLEIPVPTEATELKAAAVTTEPAGGLPQPSGQFALLGAIQ